MSHQPFPLEWPIGRARTPSRKRKSSAFKALGFGRARDDLVAELRRFGARDVVLSTSIPVRLDGLPLASFSRQPDDPGVAVYFSLSGESREAPRRYYAIACDGYRKVEENLRALVHTIAAMRTIERHGSSQLLEQAMSGFAALPAEGESGAWWTTLGFAERPNLADAKTRWRELVAQNHPDRGGSPDRMVVLNDAIDRAEREDTGA